MPCVTRSSAVCDLLTGLPSVAAAPRSSWGVSERHLGSLISCACHCGLLCWRGAGRASLQGHCQQARQHHLRLDGCSGHAFSCLQGYRW